MPASLTKDELLGLLPSGGNAETERARGLFLAWLRLRDALDIGAHLDAIGAWRARARTVAALEALPDDTLRDIGLRRGEILSAADGAYPRRAARRHG
jgi:uncharacterized protein YjiS (DUF1127 family)